MVVGCLATGFDGESDWLTLYLPVGALARTDQRVGAFPFGADGGRSSLGWRAGLDSWLAKVAAGVFSDIHFELVACSR